MNTHLDIFCHFFTFSAFLWHVYVSVSLHVCLFVYICYTLPCFWIADVHSRFFCQSFCLWLFSKPRLITQLYLPVLFKINKKGKPNKHLTCVWYFFFFQYISIKIKKNTVYLDLKTALHVSGGISTHHQEHTQLYLQHLVLVKPLLLRSNGLTSTRCCRYSCVCSWWWVEIPPETCRAVFRSK